MAHPAMTILPARMDTLSFRRADGSRQEIAFDAHGSTPRRPPFTNPGAAPTTHTAAGTRYPSAYNPGSRYSHPPGHDSGSGSGYGSRYGSSYNSGYSHPFTQLHRQEPRPRNAMRKYRQDNDEPVEGTVFVRETRQSICIDGRDRSACSQCRQAVTAGARRSRKACHSSATPPERVFRDLIMTDAGEPLQPALREALCGAFASSRRADSPSQEKHTSPSSPSFPSFRFLPYEIRRMIWEAALPSRVLLREDLCQTTYRSVSKTFRPGNHAHSLEELWQSDLFYVCVEARRVVEAKAAAGKYSTRKKRPATPMHPLIKNVTTRAKLQAGLDVLYYPWMGTKEARERGGGGPIRHGPPYMAPPEARALAAAHQHTCACSRSRPSSRGTSLAATAAAAVFSSPPLSPYPVPPSPQLPASHQGYAGLGVYCMPGLYPGFKTETENETASDRIEVDVDVGSTAAGGPAPCPACYPLQVNKTTTPPRTPPKQASSSSIVPYPASAIPYGHWASQLRILRVPAPTVALDMAWLDKKHADTLAWAVGVDLAEPPEPKGGGRGGKYYYNNNNNNAYAPKPVPPESLQVVLADLIVPVRIRLSGLSSPKQKELLQRHVYAQPASGTAHAHAEFESDSEERERERDGVANLNGKDFTVLVDLYDDGRMEELLSLMGDDADEDEHEDEDKNSKVLNKAALHRCIGCTRRAWEARSRAGSATSWSKQFGALVGGQLQKICRPTVLVTAVLVFDSVLS